MSFLYKFKSCYNLFAEDTCRGELNEQKIEFTLIHGYILYITRNYTVVLKNKLFLIFICFCVSKGKGAFCWFEAMDCKVVYRLVYLKSATASIIPSHSSCTSASTKMAEFSKIWSLITTAVFQSQIVMFNEC